MADEADNFEQEAESILEEMLSWSSSAEPPSALPAADESAMDTFAPTPPELEPFSVSVPAAPSLPDAPNVAVALPPAPNFQVETPRAASILPEREAEAIRHPDAPQVRAAAVPAETQIAERMESQAAPTEVPSVKSAPVPAEVEVRDEPPAAPSGPDIPKPQGTVSPAGVIDPPYFRSVAPPQETVIDSRADEPRSVKADGRLIDEDFRGPTTPIQVAEDQMGQMREALDQVIGALVRHAEWTTQMLNSHAARLDDLDSGGERRGAY